jgi:hypothetical protein
MIALGSMLSYLGMLVLAAFSGALGGVAYELLKTHGKENQTGWFERPQPRNHGYYDVGSTAGVFVGAIAAVAAMYFFPPTESIPGSTTIPPAMQYNFIKVVALSLIVGSAGGSFLNAMQARVQATLQAQKTEATKNVGKQQIDNFAEQLANIAAEAIAEVLGRHSNYLQDLVRTSAQALPDVARDVVKKHVARIPDLQSLLEMGQAPAEPEKKIDVHAEQSAEEVRELVRTRTAVLVKAAHKNIEAAAGSN